VFPGCVVIISNTTTILYQNAYGTLSYRQDIYEQPVRNDTLYDIASLTKSMGTAAAILTLYNSHLLALEDTVAKYIPEYDNSGKRNITIGHLLLHCAGLPYDYPGALPSTPDEVMQYLVFMRPIYEVGSQFQYSNLGYVMLGEIVKRITKRTLGDYYHQNQVFMGLKETMFNPGPELTYRTAPCEYDEEIRHRIVRERLAYFLGGETGHSGYFTIANDVTRYAQILLSLGKVGNENRIFQQASVEKFITRVEGLPYNNTRGYGKT
jgi:CubicO group peptidase (beta-lactamase class C family)